MSSENGREIIKSGAQVAVLLPLSFNHGFDYRTPVGMELRPGDYVRVPFGRKSLWGVVWGAGTGEVEERKIREIERLSAHIPPMSGAMRGFIDWLAWYTLSPKGMVLKMAISAPDAFEPPAEEARYLLSEAAPARMTPARRRIVAYLSDGVPRSAKEIAAHARVSAPLVREFAKAGGLVPEPLCETPKIIARDEGRIIPAPASLSQSQQEAARALREKLTGGFSVTVLDGVTGSGKTEVYFDTIAECIREGRQALVLLPEIGLSVQWLSRFEARFGFTPDVWHSNVSAKRKREAWRDAAEGNSLVVVGARSALFLPFSNLGFIVVDEEHDASYKQEQGVIYHARDMAVARARHEKIPALLVSATPSMETEYNMEHKRYARLHLPGRHGEAELPRVRLVDMRGESLPSGSWLSDTLREALVATLAQKRQAMLFINRRGYAPLMLCRACGHRFECPHCTGSLVLHRRRGKLLCHHCGHVASVPALCPHCSRKETLVACGPGVERIAEETRALLPDARIEVMTSDHMETSGNAEALVNAMIAGEIDVLIGTQMIAKGHHFARLALVGVVDADMGLSGGDLRAGERTYQLLHQLSGRAGREKTKGEVWLQTYLPEHPVMQALAAGDRDRFMLLEARMRQEAEMPPYGKLTAVIVEGKNERKVEAFARELVKAAGEKVMGETGSRENGESLAPVPRLPAPLVLGPAPAPLMLLRGKYRYRILVKAARGFAMQSWLAGWLNGRKVPASIRVKTDVDPYSFI